MISPSTEEHVGSVPDGTEGDMDAAVAAVVARYYAGLIRSTELEEERAGLLGGTIRVARHPVGAIGAIVPWNYPQTLAMFKLAPGLSRSHRQGRVHRFDRGW